MPCLNEAETLAACIDEARTAIESCGIVGEIVIADNGSVDGSQEIAHKLGAQVVAVPSRGYGNALIGGIKRARGKYVMMGDADGSYNFGELNSFLTSLNKGNDLVMGCRLPRGGGNIETGAMPWKHRWIGNPVLSGIGKFLFRSPVDDFHCGLRAFRRELILQLDLRCSGMEFASEMVVKAVVNKLKIDQVPITLRPDGRNRPPHLNSWRDGWRHLKFMLLFSPKWLFFVPGLLMFIMGFLGMAVLAFGPLAVGKINFDTNSMLFCAISIIIGFQTMFFALFIKAFAIHNSLLQPDSRLRRLLKGNPIEWGVIIGGTLLSCGLFLFGYVFLDWKRAEFGALSYSDSLRIVIPAVTLMALGVQSVFCGFALGFFGLVPPAKSSH
jgi:glycosyltransferase involved in cell wall biosynthesis